MPRAALRHGSSPVLNLVQRLRAYSLPMQWHGLLPDRAGGAALPRPPALAHQDAFRRLRSSPTQRPLPKPHRTQAPLAFVRSITRFLRAAASVARLPSMLMA